MDANKTKEREEAKVWQKRVGTKAFSSIDKKGPEDRIIHGLMSLKKENNLCLQVNINQHWVQCAKASWSGVIAGLLPKVRSIVLSLLWVSALTAMRPKKGLVFQPTLPRIKPPDNNLWLPSVTPSFLVHTSLPLSRFLSVYNHPDNFQRTSVAPAKSSFCWGPREVDKTAPIHCAN